MGWQRHTVRGLFSGTLKKKLGLALASAKEERGRVYRNQKLGRTVCSCWLEWGTVVPIRQIVGPAGKEVGVAVSATGKTLERRIGDVPTSSPSDRG